MIKNERQYRITRTQADKFMHTLAGLEAAKDKATDMHPLLRQAEREALRSQLQDLQNQLAEYEALRGGEKQVFVSSSFDELPRALIMARIAAGLSQKDLAVRLGLKEQQIQRYEATDYNSASMQRVRAIIQALGVTVKEEISLAK